MKIYELSVLLFLPYKHFLIMIENYSKKHILLCIIDCIMNACSGAGIAVNSISVCDEFCVTGSEDGFMRLWPLDFSSVFLEAGWYSCQSLTIHSLAENELSESLRFWCVCRARGACQFGVCVLGRLESPSRHHRRESGVSGCQ